MTVTRMATEVVQCTCDRRTCGHTWVSVTDRTKLPTYCPKCKSPKWDTKEKLRESQGVQK